MPQVWGKVKIPAGKKIAVNLGCDFDAQSLWICLNRTSPAYMSRGEFGAEVAMPRHIKEACDGSRKYQSYLADGQRSGSLD
jgi:hypothetical protein